MKLENIVDSAKNFVKENNGFCIGAGLLTLTAMADAYVTINGLNSGMFYEVN